MRTITIIIVCLLFSISGFSQEASQQFSLQEAIDYALENNRAAKNAARDIDAAIEQKWEATSTGLPQINADIGYQNFLKQQVSLLPNAAFDNRQATINTVEEFFGLTADGSPESLEGFTPLVFGTKQNINATVTLSQLLFDGSYLVGLQSAKVFLEISKNAKDKTDLEVRKQVINAYGNVLLAEESIKVFERNLTTLQKNLDETTKIYENGLGEEESVEQLQITLAGVQSNLNNVNRLKGLAYQMFNITLGLDINNNTLLTDNLEGLAKLNLVLSLLDEDENIDNIVDYKIAANDKRAKELLLKLEKSKALPSLSAFINGGYLGNSDTFTFLNGDQQWFGSSLVGVNMSIPIFSSLGRSAATQRAKINLEKAEDDLKETEQRLLLEIKNAKSNYQFAIEDYGIKKQNLALAERIEQKNQTKFFEGIGSSFELRQAQTQLYTAQQDYLQAMLDVINKKADLETVLNNLPKN